MRSETGNLNYVMLRDIAASVLNADILPLLGAYSGLDKINIVLEETICIN